MNPVSITYTTTGAKDGIMLDWRIAPFSVSYAVIKETGGGTLSATIEVTLDNIMDPTITPVWFALGSALTATTLAALTAPVQAVRLNIDTLSGTNVTLKLLQGESIN